MKTPTLKTGYLSILFLVAACSPKMKDVTLNEHFKQSNSDTPEIIATQFKNEGIDQVPVVLVDDPRYDNAFLIQDSIYSDYDEVSRLIAKFKINSGKVYSFSIIQDTGKIKLLFEKYNTVYSGEDRMILWEPKN